MARATRLPGRSSPRAMRESTRRSSRRQVASRRRPWQPYVLRWSSGAQDYSCQRLESKAIAKYGETTAIRRVIVEEEEAPASLYQQLQMIHRYGSKQAGAGDDDTFIDSQYQLSE